MRAPFWIGYRTHIDDVVAVIDKQLVNQTSTSISFQPRGHIIARYNRGLGHRSLLRQIGSPLYDSRDVHGRCVECIEKVRVMKIAESTLHCAHIISPVVLGVGGPRCSECCLALVYTYSGGESSYPSHSNTAVLGTSRFLMLAIPFSEAPMA